MAGASHYDLLVLGSGEAGKYLAWTFAKAKRHVAVVERGLIGGSCPNIACLPSKNVINSARVAMLSRHSREYGVNSGRITVDMAGVRERKRSMVESGVAAHLERYQASGAELILGEGRFTAARTLEVKLNDGGTRTLSGERVVIDVGTRTLFPSLPGLAEASPLTHIEALELDRVPEHLLILGAGYVGMEFAQALRRFGSRVTLLEQSQQFAAREDPDVSQGLLELFNDEGIEVILDAAVARVEGRSGEGVRMTVHTARAERTLEGTDILVAAGRTPNTRGIGLELTGVALDDRGYIRVNERLETTAKDVWAVGDCAGSPQFTHVGFDDFRVIRDNWNGGHRTTRERLIPYCVFTDPELGRIGLDETQARRAGIPYRLAKVPMASVLRAQALGEKRGFLKALIDVNSERILGFTAFGVEASEIIAVVQTAMLTGAPYTLLRDAILAHPTVAEGLSVLFYNEPQRAP